MRRILEIANNIGAAFENEWVFVGVWTVVVLAATLLLGPGGFALAMLIGMVIYLRYA